MSQRSKHQIMVVDGNSAMRRVTRSILKQLGHTNCIEVDTAENAMRHVEMGGIDLIICEWTLPLMSGLEFLRKIRSEPAFSHTKFIIISNDAQQDNIVQAVLSKVSAYIVRPFSADILGKKIDSLLETKTDSPSGNTNSSDLTSKDINSSEPATLLLDIIQNNKILTYFQPIISFKTKNIIGFEALSRGFKDSPSDVIAPNVLFKMAEELDLITQLDAACRRKALTDFLPIYKSNPKLILGLNIHSHYIENEIYNLSDLYDISAVNSITPQSLILDLRESQIASHVNLFKFVQEQKNRGYLIAFDNIGDSPINFERIAEFKPSLIKIDKSLISSLDRDFYKQESIKTLVNLANKIGAITVAIGVEREDEVLALLKFGVYTLQGFYFGLPTKDKSNIVEHFNKQIIHNINRFNERALKKISSTKDKFDKLHMSITEAISLLELTDQIQYEKILLTIIENNDLFDCIFIISFDGIQLTNTITPFSESNVLIKSLSPLTSKFHDHSLRDYYLHIRAGYSRFITDTYISPLSGMLCKTLSQQFVGNDGNKYILCIEARIEN